MKAYTLSVENGKIISKNYFLLDTPYTTSLLNNGIYITKELITPEYVKILACKDTRFTYISEIGIKKEVIEVTETPKIPNSVHLSCTQTFTRYSACHLNDAKQKKIGILAKLEIEGPDNRYGDNWDDIAKIVEEISKLFLSIAVSPNPYNDGNTLIISGITNCSISTFKQQLGQYIKYIR